MKSWRSIRSADGAIRRFRFGKPGGSGGLSVLDVGRDAIAERPFVTLVRGEEYQHVFAAKPGIFAQGPDLPEVSYVVIHEVPQDSWGYGGLTQQHRAKAA